MARAGCQAYAGLLLGRLMHTSILQRRRGVAAVELCRGKRRELQRGAEREAGGVELQCAFEDRRDHDKAADDDTLLLLQRACDLHAAEPAIAFAKQIFGRVGAAVFRDV